MAVSRRVAWALETLAETRRLLAVVIFLLMLAAQAGAQEVTDKEVTEENVTARSGDATKDVTVQAEDVVANDGTVDSRAESTVGDVVDKAARQGQVEFVEGEQANDAQRTAQESGPLAGKSVETLDTDGDRRIDLLRIPGNCKAEEGASFVLEDEDGTQGTFIDNRNVQITDESTKFLRVRDNPPGTNIVPLLERGGDDALDSGGLTVVTSTDITCVQPDPDGGDSGDDGDGKDGGDGGSGDGGGGTGDGNGEVSTQPQDKEKGPLAGGTANGADVLVPGDQNCGPTRTEFNCIDQITIDTENCELTANGDELTITVSDQGVPFRLIDGQNVDITIRDDGTIVVNGRETLGDLFPKDMRNNPDRVIIPIPVEEGNDDFSEAPNDTFPIVSSTGIGGEGCKVAGQSVDDGNNNAGDTSDPDDVVPGTDPGGNLSDTGGPLFGFMVAGLILTGGGLLLRSTTMRRG